VYLFTLKQWVLNTERQWKNMGKYQISVGLTFELIQLIEKKMEEGNYQSRSALIEEVLRQNLDDECIQCKATKKLVDKRLLHIPIELGYPFTDEMAEKYILDYERIEIAVDKYRKERKHAERSIFDVVKILSLESEKGWAQLIDVLNEAEQIGIPREKAEEVIDALNQNGRLMRPSGYDTLCIV